jgi:hypothetical protein
VKEMEKQNLTPVSARFLSDDSLGGVSGGTVASIMNVIESSSWKKLEELGNPFYLGNLSIYVFIVIKYDS